MDRCWPWHYLQSWALIFGMGVFNAGPRLTAKEGAMLGTLGKTASDSGETAIQGRQWGLPYHVLGMVIM